MVISPAMTISVPAAASQLKLNVGDASGSPGRVMRSSPGQWKVIVTAPRRARSLMAVICARQKIAMMIRYGA